MHDDTRHGSGAAGNSNDRDADRGEIAATTAAPDIRPEPTAALVPQASAPPPTLYKTAEEARDYAREARAPNTRRAYRADWADFAAWCAAHGLPALPASPEAVALYLTDRAKTRTVATLQRRLSAIAVAHKTKGYVSPTAHAAVRDVWAGIRRAKGTAPRGKEPARASQVARMAWGRPATLAGHRDRALLLLGFAGAFRRSELVALDVADLAFHDHGLTVTIRRSKTDQEGAGRPVGIPPARDPEACPVVAVRRWLNHARIADGPLFRPVVRQPKSGRETVRPRRLSAQSVALIVKRAAAEVGLDAAIYAGHSLRSGFATSAAEAGKSERAIMAQTGHKSLPILRRYIRAGSLFHDNAADGLL